tara:strand:+ start:852 stop:974 length:123 start_codon:yes stop_codon:yes gene_type:complete
MSSPDNNSSKGRRRRRRRREVALPRDQSMATDTREVKKEC